MSRIYEIRQFEAGTSAEPTSEVTELTKLLGAIFIPTSIPDALEYCIFLVAFFAVYLILNMRLVPKRKLQGDKEHRS